MGFIIAAAVAAAVIAFCFLCYKKAPPTQAIVVTGFGLSRPKVVCGRGAFVLPIVQRADRLNMRLLKIDVKTPETGVKTKEGVSLWLDSVVTVQVYSENSTVSDEEVRNAGYDDIRKYINSRQQAAISNFLGMDEAHINEKINDVLQGNLREIVSEMTVDQILTNRKQMAVSVVENARPDLAKMGLEVVTFNVQDVKDAVDAMGHNHGVIEAIGVEQEELVKKRASIAKAEAERDVSCAKAAAAMAANEKEIEAQTAIAQRNNELELAKSKLKAEADKAAADANAAGMIQTNLRAKEVKESEADAEIARQKKMVDLAAQEAEVQQRKLDAEVRKQADAELYRRQKEARRCSASTTVTPCRFITAIISCSCAMAAASRLLVGSSSTNSRGPSIQAAANATRCFSPPDSLKTLRSISGPSWNCSTTSSTRRRMACGSMPAFSQGKASSAVVSTLKYWVLGFWNTLPTCGT